MPSRPNRLPPILYQDEALIAFDKPSGLLTAPDRWDKNLPCLTGLAHELLSPEVQNAHRLDRDASGVLLFARTADALRSLREQFDAQLVRKAYVALVNPGPREPKGEIVAPLAPDLRRPGRMRASVDGKESRTSYEVLEAFRGGWSLLRAEPHTGRTHQIRVHLAHNGSPIVGDVLYGDGQPLLLSQIKRGYKPGRHPEHPLMGRLALHARTLTLRHPLSGADITFESPLPEDFEIALKYLRRFGG
jgi:RluA family pseudouridine synthase